MEILGHKNTTIYSRKQRAKVTPLRKEICQNEVDVIGFVMELGMMQ